MDNIIQRKKDGINRKMTKYRNFKKTPVSVIRKGNSENQMHRTKSTGVRFIKKKINIIKETENVKKNWKTR